MVIKMKIVIKIITSQMKWIQTLSLLSIYLLQAICVCSFYGTLLDFAEKLDATIHQVAFGHSVRAIGICIGSFGGGFLLKFGDKLLFCASFLIIEGISIFIVGNVEILCVYYAMNFTIGLANGCLETGTVLLLAELWQSKSRPFLQSLSFIFNSASIIVPLAMKPFLSQNTCIGKDLTLNASSITLDELPLNAVPLTPTELTLNASILNDTNLVDDCYQETQLWIPFSFIANAAFIVAFVSLVIQCYNLKTMKTKETEVNVKEVESENSMNSGPKFHKIFVIVTCSLCIFLVNGIAAIFPQFWVCFAVFFGLKLSKSSAVLMLTVLSGTMTLGSLGGILISIKLTALPLVGIHLVFISLGSAILFILAETSEIMLWVGGALISLGLGNFYATSFSLLHERVKMTNFIGSLFVFSSMVSHALGFAVFIGHYIEPFPMVFVYTMIFGAFSIGFLSFLLILLDYWKKNSELSLKTKEVEK